MRGSRSLVATLAACALSLPLADACDDRRVDCAALSRAGRCAEDAEVVYECPASCGVCAPMCQDTRVECPTWYQAGECAGNPDAMREACPLSCGLCAPVCTDLSVDCARWAREGRCVQPHPASVVCMQSCGQCDGSLCQDAHASCPKWALAEQCLLNAEYMRRTCPVSCRACKRRGRSACADGNATQCAGWRRQCGENPAVASFCPQTCGVCAARCVDKSSRCEGWRGECAREPALLAICPQTCGVCAALRADADHDEL